MILPRGVSLDPTKSRRWWVFFLLGLLSGAALFSIGITLLVNFFTIRSTSRYVMHEVSTPRGHDTFSVALDTSDGSQGAYFIPVYIGTGSQTYADTLLDSGSADTWFDIGLNFTVNSVTYKGFPNQQYEIDYMQGNVYGTLGQDKLAIVNFSWLQTIGVVSDGEVDVNGIIGISRGGCDSRNLCSMENWPLNQSVLGFYYDTSSWNGIFMAGYVDQSLYCAEGTKLTYLPQVGDYYWTGSVDVAFNDHSLGKGLTAIFDTGTTYFMVSANLNNTISTLIGPNSLCNTSSITLTISGQQFKIPSSVLVTSDELGHCMLRIDVLPPDQGFDVIVGATFLVNFYTVFDIGNNKMGFCPPKPGLLPSTRRLADDPLGRLLLPRPRRRYSHHRKLNNTHV